METNRDAIEHIFDEDNATNVEEQRQLQDSDVRVSECAPTISNASGSGGPRSIVWPEFLVIPASEFEDGMKRATCKHCESKTFIADSRYGTSNMKKHLEKCTAYQAAKAVKVGSEEVARFDPKVYRDLVAKAII